MARAIWAWSATDVYGHEAYLNPQPLDYTPPVGDGLWVQTQQGDGGRAMFPNWGKTRICKEGGDAAFITYDVAYAAKAALKELNNCA